MSIPYLIRVLPGFDSTVDDYYHSLDSGEDSFIEQAPPP